MPGLFDWLGDLTQHKQGLYNVETENKYVPFIINRGLANYIDCILFAQQMNVHHRLDPSLQYDFYLYGLSKGRRYGKWAKKIKLDKKDEEDIELVSQYYQVSPARASSYIEILSKEELERIRHFFKGNDSRMRQKNKGSK